MKLKKQISVFLVFITAALLFAPAAAADPVGASGTLDGEGLFTWAVENGTLTVSYNGETPAPMPDLPFDGDAYSPIQPWEAYIRDVTRIAVTGKVTRIGDNAFYNAWRCTRVDLPEGLEEIGECAFQFCASLRRISLPSTLKTIGYSGFYCSGLEEIAVPEGVTAIGRMAFAYCTKLSVADLPSTLHAFERNVFLLCQRLYAIVDRSNSVAVFDQTEGMVVAFDTVSHNERNAKYHDLEEDPILYDACGRDDEAFTAEIVTRYNEAYGTSFTTIEEVQADCSVGLIDAPAGGYVTVYCNTGSAEQAFCEEKGVNYVLIDAGENYCVHRVTLNYYMEPGCTENGYRGGAVCMKCEKVFETPEIVPPKGHSPETVPAVPPTCTRAGLTEGSVCSECGAVLTEQTEIPAAGHRDENGDGVCDVCSHVLSEPDPEPEEGSLFERIRRFAATIIDRLLALFRKLFG
ncbi:MAG: leucine-rich repeat protein [Clostridia bacterium]|nr:leucine-rich repeat protein [Clostridia bacterium]